MLEFSKKDLLQGTVLEADWYLITIDQITEALSKNGNSTNFWFEGTVVKNASNGETKYEGVPLRWNINSQFSSTLLAFLKIFGIEGELNKKYDMGFFNGKQMVVFVEPKLYDGRLINNVKQQFKAA